MIKFSSHTILLAKTENIWQVLSALEYKVFPTPLLKYDMNVKKSSQMYGSSKEVTTLTTRPRQLPLLSKVAR